MKGQRHFDVTQGLIGWIGGFHSRFSQTLTAPEQQTNGVFFEDPTESGIEEIVDLNKEEFNRWMREETR